MRKYQCKRVCGLGVFKGDNFMEMIAHGPKLAVAIDTWKNEVKSQFEYFKNRVDSLPFVRILRENATRAAKRFDDNYFDFVYVDADHSIEDYYSALLDWYLKIKPGKFLVGNNYRRGSGVVDAVNRFIRENNLELILFYPSNWAVIKK